MLNWRSAISEKPSVGGAGCSDADSLRPLKQVGKDVVKTGVQSAVDSLNDLAEGRKPSTKKISKNFKNLGKKSIKRVSKNLADAIDESPQPRKKGKYVKKKYAKKNKKKSIYDE